MKKKELKRPCTIYYRKLIDYPWSSNETLQQQVQKAMDTNVKGDLLRNKFKNRIYALNENSLFINVFVDDKTRTSGGIFGDITMFSSGKMQAIIESETDAPTANVEHIIPPQKKEFMNSIMYWMIHGNHVFIMQSMEIRSDTVEAYFGWLLGECTNLISSQASIVLVNKFDPKKIKLSTGKTKSLIIGGAIRPIPSGENQENKNEDYIETLSEVNQTQVTGWEQAKAVLAAVVKSPASLTKIMDAIPKDTELSVEVHIGFKSKRKKFKDTPLSVLESGLRNMPDSFLEIEGQDGKRHPDGSLRLHHKSMIKLYMHDDPGGRGLAGMPDHLDVLRAMQEAYSSFIAEGKIEK